MRSPACPGRGLIDSGGQDEFILNPWAGECLQAWPAPDSHGRVRSAGFSTGQPRGGQNFIGRSGYFAAKLT
jgi:hypothetical protein